MSFQYPRKQKLLTTSAPTSAQTATAIIDTLGVDFVTIGLAFGTVAATNPEIAIKIGEGDTTSAFTDIPALVGGGTSGFTFPTPPTNTSVTDTMQFDIDCRKRKRFLQLSVTPFTTKQVTAWAAYGPTEQGPLPATSDNLMARVAV